MLVKEYEKLKALLTEVQSGKVSDREMSKLIVQLTEVSVLVIALIQPTEVYVIFTVLMLF